jgi:hypothetical protein
VKRITPLKQSIECQKTQDEVAQRHDQARPYEVLRHWS